jgi:hypothetical protein
MRLAEPIRFLTTLQREGLIGPFAIGGSIAALQYIAPRHTHDVDFFADIHATGLAVMSQIYQKASELGYAVEAEHIIVDGTPVQILPPLNALYVEALDKSVEKTVDGMTVRVFTPEYIVAIALQTKRFKDYDRVESFINEYSALNQNALADLITRFNLGSSWRKFKEGHVTDRKANLRAWQIGHIN